MCGYCCGGVPVERRGAGHKGCSTECYNALSPRQVRDYVTRAERAEDALARARALLTDPATKTLESEPALSPWLRDLREAIDPTSTPHPRQEQR